MILKITALCVAVAMICAALRVQRPEIAMAVSMAGGLAALAMLWADMPEFQKWLDAFGWLLRGNGDITAVILKGAGIAIISELGAQLCVDAGERALAGRIALAARVATLGLCAPMLMEIAERLGTAAP